MPCVPINLIIAVILNPILRYLQPSQPEIVFLLSQLRSIPFFAIYAKTKSFRASELPCVPINSIITIILNPILRSLRPSEAEIYLGWVRHKAHIKMRILRKMQHYSEFLPKIKLLQLGPLIKFRSQNFWTSDVLGDFCQVQDY